MTAYQNVEVDITYYLDVIEGRASWLAIALRANDNDQWQVVETSAPDAIMPYNGYALRLRNTQNSDLRVIEDGTPTDLIDPFSANIVGGEHECRVRFQIDGTTLRFKEWVTSGSEPSTWEEVTDSTFSGAGAVRLGFAGSTADADHIALIRDLKVTNLDTATVVFDAAFTGANGDPWPAAQFDHIEVRRNPDTMDIQGNEGRILAGQNGWGRTVLILSEAAATPLDTPTNFTFTAHGSLRQLNGSWSAVPNADSYEYEVDEETSPGAGTWTNLVSDFTSGTSFQLDDTDGVDWATTYRCRVRAHPAE